jgi:hypothetical protein
MPQKDATGFCPVRIGGVPTKSSRSRQFGRNFASDGGTSSAIPSLRSKIIRARSSPGPQRYLTSLVKPARRSGSARKSALDSRSCGFFCPGAAVDTTELHDKIGEAQKMHKFNEFGVFSPPSRRGGTRAEPPQNFCGACARERTRTAQQGDLRGLGADSYPLGRIWYAAIAPTLCSKPIFGRQKARQPLVGSPV